MRTPLLFRTLSTLLLIFVIVATILFSFTRPRIMIVHSYSPEHPWVRDVNKSLKDFIQRWANYSVSWHYLRADHATDHDWLRKAQVGAMRAIAQVSPDILVALDDPAQAWVAREYLRHPHMQIVVAGVDAPFSVYGYDKATNVYGIAARKPLAVVVEMLQVIEAKRAPSGRRARLAYVSDASPGALKERPYLDDFDWQPFRYSGSYVAHNYDEWQTLISTLGRQNDYILVANYRSLRRSASDAHFVPPQEVMRWSEIQSQVPLIGLHGYNAEDGAMLSLGPSPYEQGRSAAYLVEMLLSNGTNSARFFDNHQYVVAMRKSALTRRKIELPPIYHAFSNATGNYFD
jgi:ABC-type uncharacterized transport system substrate-binding protein